VIDIKNPNDSLYSYFDELFSDDDGDSLTDSHAEQLSIFPVDILPLNTTDTATTSPLSGTDDIAKKIVVKAIATTNFADPNADQKQKLQKLLHSVGPKIDVKSAVEVETISIPAVISSFQTDPNEIQEWITEPITAATTFIENDVSLENIVASQDVAQTYQMPGLEWLPNGLPQWAQTRFDVLLFKVSGLTLAVPLISLGKIRPISGGLSPLFGQAEWFMGLQLTTTGKIYTVNTAKFVMPERYDENFAKNAKYVISINGVPWGLAVDSVNQPIRLAPDEVKWRTNRSKRPWLAGTIKEHMCALLDIPMIGQMLMDADKNYAKSHLS
jgi:purine-binding chemotaxis protein CheW